MYQNFMLNLQNPKEYTFYNDFDRKKKKTNICTLILFTWNDVLFLKRRTIRGKKKQYKVKGKPVGKYGKK